MLILCFLTLSPAPSCCLSWNSSCEQAAYLSSCLSLLDGFIAYHVIDHPWWLCLIHHDLPFCPLVIQCSFPSHLRVVWCSKLPQLSFFGNELLANVLMDILTCSLLPPECLCSCHDSSQLCFLASNNSPCIIVELAVGYFYQPSPLFSNNYPGHVLVQLAVAVSHPWSFVDEARCGFSVLQPYWIEWPYITFFLGSSWLASSGQLRASLDNTSFRNC